MSMTSEGLWYLGERSLEIRPLEVPDPAPDEVLVEIEACGICTWDIVSYLGKFGRYQRYPFCAGHEGVGRVVRTGPRVTTAKQGQRVVLHEVPVGTPGGALMARHAVRPQRQVAVVPEGPIPIHHWIVEPAACIVNGILYAGIQPGDRVALVGAGYMGLLFVQALRKTLASRVCAFDVQADRLALAARLGASQTWNLKDRPVSAEVARSFDVVIETAGTQESLKTALAVLRPGGILENFAWHHHEASFDLEDWHVNGWRILNVQPGMNPHFGDLYPRTISLIEAGVISNAELVTHWGPVSKAKEIFESAADKTNGYVKGVITF
ncbi:MAG TPA: alcohol dehydrogenase catalytic domain-containing protein [Spirochaetia bacterium]|nr:alcohol dehydrogenase catalytic domain-containing protein [Spirochaetia bacterium]